VVLPEEINMTTHETTTLGSDTLLMIRSFREANPDKRDRHLSAAEFLRKNANRIRGIGPLLEWRAWLSKMPNRLSVGALPSA
jgi:hypothetical protein